MTLRRHLPAALALVAIATLPLVAERLRGHRERCEMDGVVLNPAFRVRVTGADGTAHGFCGVSCAESWLARSGVSPGTILVTDGVTGCQVDAQAAWYVRTLGNVSDGAPDVVRVFARREDALRHADAHGGRLLAGAERPFWGMGASDEQEEN